MHATKGTRALEGSGICKSPSYFNNFDGGGCSSQGQSVVIIDEVLPLDPSRDWFDDRRWESALCGCYEPIAKVHDYKNSQSGFIRLINLTPMPPRGEVLALDDNIYFYRSVTQYHRNTLIIDSESGGDPYTIVGFLGQQEGLRLISHVNPNRLYEIKFTPERSDGAQVRDTTYYGGNEKTSTFFVKRFPKYVQEAIERLRGSRAEADYPCDSIPSDKDEPWQKGFQIHSAAPKQAWGSCSHDLIDIGRTPVRVLRQDIKTSLLFVRVLAGKHAGKEGWLISPNPRIEGDDKRQYPWQYYEAML